MKYFLQALFQKREGSGSVPMRLCLMDPDPEGKKPADPDPDPNPQRCFVGTEVSYVEYYKTHWNIDIKDLDQPLLEHR